MEKKVKEFKNKEREDIFKQFDEWGNEVFDPYE